ncbi:MAG TPA: hypothetical protein RMI62_20090, partial [Polyangiaceae bacterium LLY-WYZ-15_(1-7)]|nr:hypothetical protein [Polyangiaceae bacterium LLY-WYZ-15_(1-7)]
MADVKVAIEEGRSGKPRPAYLLVGSETLLVERAITALRRATVGPGGVPGFNEDLFHGGSGLEGSTVVAAATTLPMMADTRFVLLRRVDQVRAAGQAELAAYLAKPSPSTCLVMTAEKIAGNTKLGRAAKKHGVRFDAKPLKGGALRGFIVDEAKGRGHPLAQEAAQALLDALGDDLAAI